LAELPKTNPYPGPRPFRPGEKLYGRDAEITQLFYLLSAERIVVLHSPSGAGKSSLLLAGLVPRLQKERFDVWPVIRLSLAPGGAEAAGNGNRFVWSAVSSLEEGLPERRRRPNDTIAHKPLAQYIAERPRRPGAPSSIVLVFDQFEEILTLDPLDADVKREFFRQLGEALKNPDVWALFALREDYLAPLDPHRDDVPTRLSNTFRIDLLSVEAALAAITQPAHDAGRAFANDAARNLADDLATVSIQQLDGSFRQVRGRYVEPVQLQVVCRRSWDALPAETQTIGVEHLQAAGNVNEALAAYYEHCVAEIARGNIADERRLREWFGERLITPGGIRGQILRGQTNSGGLDNDWVARLLDTHLVRSEQRGGATWYELAHDRLVAPVGSSNSAWFEENLHPMQRQAALWERGGRPDNLLLRGQDLKRAESWARDNAASLLAIERDLLDRSAKQRRRDRTRRGTLALFVLGLVIGLCVVYRFYVRANELYKRASEQQLALISGNLLREGDTTRALRVGQEAYDIDRDHVLPAVNQTLIDGYEKVNVESAALYDHILKDDGAVKAAIYSPDGSRILTIPDDGTATLWSNDGPLIHIISKMKHKDGNGELQEVLDAAFTHHGDKIITVGRGTLVKMWDPNGNYIRDLTGHECGHYLYCMVTKVAVSPDDQTIITVSGDRTAIIWSNEGKKLGQLTEHQSIPAGMTGLVNTVVFSPDGQYFATGGGDRDHTVQLYDKSGHYISTIEHHCDKHQSWECGIRDIAFSPDDKFILIASEANAIEIYDATRKSLSSLNGHSGGVNSLVYSPADAASFLSASDDKLTILWSYDGKNFQQKQAFIGHADAVKKAVFSWDGKSVLTASSDNSARLWDLEGHTLATFGGHKAGVVSVLFSPDKKHILTASTDKTAIQWERPPTPRVLEHRGRSVLTARFLPDGKRILTASNGKDERNCYPEPRVELWNADNPSAQPRTYSKITSKDPIYGNLCRIESLDVSHDGKRFLTTGSDQMVRVWETETGRLIKQWSDKDNCNSSGACWPDNARYSRDGRYIVTVDTGGLVQLFDADGTFEKKLPLTAAKPIAISSDSTQVLIGSGSRILLWDITTGNHEYLTGDASHTKEVRWVEFSDKGNQAVSASADGTVILWDLIDHRSRIIGHHAGDVWSVEFSPDMKHIVSASSDKTAKIWDLDGQPVDMLEPHRGALVFSADFSPTGETVVTASDDGTAIIWKDAKWIVDNWLRNAADVYKLTTEDRKELGIDDK
jgi:WD40 repeat protein